MTSVNLNLYVRTRRGWVLPVARVLCCWWLPLLPDRWIDRYLIVLAWLAGTEYRIDTEPWRPLRWE